MIVNAYAKINWYLKVTGKRPDGYHELEMLMQQVQLHDVLHLTLHDDCLIQVKNTAYVPANENNLAFKAVSALKKHTGHQGGVQITLEKRIPVGAGLGGGSADAAAVLKGLNELWQLGLSEDELCTIGLTIGADVPFCLRGGFARVCGIGEIITQLKSPPPCWILIIQPCRGLSTKDVFSRFRLSDLAGPSDSSKLALALEERDYAAVAVLAHNDLQKTASDLRAAIPAAIADIKNAGAKHAMMTGSGSAVFGVFNNYRHATDAFSALQKKYRHSYLTQTLAASSDEVLKEGQVRNQG